MKRFFFLLVSALALSCSSSMDQKQHATATAAPSASAYSSEAKTMPVGVIPAAVIHDAARNKDLELSIDYPTQGGPYPVIVFSHGYGAQKNAYVGLSAFWASHGYVVIRPHHADFGILKMPERTFEDLPRQRRRREPAEAKAIEFHADPGELWQTQTAADWTNRVGDVTFVLNSIPKLIEQFPEIKDRVDATKIGVGGHSYGAMIAMLAGGAKASAAGNLLSYADPRVKAIEAMSPPGPAADRGLIRDSFATIAVPALFLTGSRDYGTKEAEDVAWRKQAFEASPAGDKWFLSVSGVAAPAFTGIMSAPIFQPAPMPAAPAEPRPGPMNPQPQQLPPPDTPRARDGFRELGQASTVRTVSLAFWDAYLKGDAAAKDYLKKLAQRSDLQAESK
jgi:dienelactone hydrolase